MATKKSAVKDLTNGSPVKLILGFALPLLLGMLFQQFYSMVDTIIVGKFLGAKALAAVGSTGSINFMIVGFCMGVCSGFAIPVAQMFGAGDRKALCRYVGNGAVLAGILSVVMTVLVCIWCRDILILMKTPSDILDGAYAYIFVIFLGIPLMVLYNQTSAIMRSLGDSRSPLIFLGISSILNIVLDLALVRPMGVAGTAWATIIAQGVSGFLCLFYMKKKFTILAFTREDWKLHKHYVLNLCNMGIPMGLQYSITAIGSVILQTAVNGLGSCGHRRGPRVLCVGGRQTRPQHRLSPYRGARRVLRQIRDHPHQRCQRSCAMAAGRHRRVRPCQAYRRDLRQAGR